MNSIQVEPLFETMAIHRPYFAFDDISYVEKGDINKGIVGKFKRQQPTAYESGSITSSEAGRHMAILGAYLSGMATPAKSELYHLVTKAIVWKTDDDVTDDKEQSDKEYTATAYPVNLNGKLDEVETTLSYNGVDLYKISLTYKIIPKGPFSRFFKDVYIEDYLQPEFNPYTDDPDLSVDSIESNRIKCHLSPLTPEQCAGHFPHYSFAPLAILNHGLRIAVGKLLSEHLDTENLKFSICFADITAEHLIRHGEKIEYDATIISSETLKPRTVGNKILIDCKIGTESKVCVHSVAIAKVDEL